MSLKGKVALITGASQVPGSTIAIALAQEGAKVAVEGASGVQERVLRMVETFGGEALPVRGDVVNESDVNHVLSNVEAILGPVDILVNASGRRLRKSVEDTSAEEWDGTLGSKVRSAFLCSRAVMPGMKERGSGHVISIGSGQSVQGEANQTALCASEHALIGFNRALTREVAGSGIRVSLLIPEGSIKGQEYEGSSGIDPEEIAQGVVYLASQMGSSSGTHLILRP